MDIQILFGTLLSFGGAVIAYLLKEVDSLKKELRDMRQTNTEISLRLAHQEGRESVSSHLLTIENNLTQILEKLK